MRNCSILNNFTYIARLEEGALYENRGCKGKRSNRKIIYNKINEKKGREYMPYAEVSIAKNFITDEEKCILARHLVSAYAE
ncbi:hypothetical protein [Clostridium cibarium]|uniref:Uncharacterized protein n=1 Tax=Clostridium cibarium TaxID=2762247 RepID=A0ABR8PTX2_9CLOT|nr:hypothetical protein [Clostridium cibarium]MBD7911638.1 hypothetical protein [Clostridium cibarium]